MAGAQGARTQPGLGPRGEESGEGEPSNTLFQTEYKNQFNCKLSQWDTVLCNKVFFDFSFFSFFVFF